MKPFTRRPLRCRYQNCKHSSVSNKVQLVRHLFITFLHIRFASWINYTIIYPKTLYSFLSQSKILMIYFSKLQDRISVKVNQKQSMYWITSKPVRFGTMREQSDQVPIIVNDALEDEALSWENSPIEGKISNYQ